MCFNLQVKATCLFSIWLWFIPFSLMTLDEVDEVVGGGVVGGNWLVIGQLRFNGLGQLLAELNTVNK